MPANKDLIEKLERLNQADLATQNLARARMAMQLAVMQLAEAKIGSLQADVREIEAIIAKRNKTIAEIQAALDAGEVDIPDAGVLN